MIKWDKSRGKIEEGAYGVLLKKPNRLKYHRRYYFYCYGCSEKKGFYIVLDLNRTV